MRSRLAKRFYNGPKLLRTPAKDRKSHFIALFGAFHRNPAQCGHRSLAPVLIIHIVQNIAGALTADKAQHTVPQKRSVHPTVQRPQGGGQCVPAQRITAAFIVNQVAETAYSSRFSRFVHSEADGARARDQDAAGAIYRAPQGNLGIAAQQQLSR